MNFTREPIIETIITPKDGYKVIVRSSKGAGYEEYSVDAVEVVSFGNSLFFRNLERPKCFLLPVSDYEVVEAKETKVVLKNIPLERTIKIGGGREIPPNHKPTREPSVAEKPAENEHPEEGAQRPQQQPSDSNMIERRKDRKRHRRRRQHDDRMDGKIQGGGTEDEAQVSSPTITTLFPPPTTLISETISRYKDLGIGEGHILPKSVTPQRQEVESFSEDRKEQDIVHEELIENEIVTFTSYPSELEDSSELFVEKQEEEKHHKVHKEELPFFESEDKT